MPHLGPIKCRDLIYYFRRLGFEGPYSGRKHQFMIRENVSVRIPNPHEGDIGEDLLAKLLKEARINRKEWEKL